MNSLYKSIGISKQAVHQQADRQRKLDGQLAVLVHEADDLRGEHPGCGVEKMYYTLAPNFIGRDRFVSLFMELGYRLKHKKNYHRTTYSSSYYYPNLISGMLLNRPSQLWQSDITYIRIGDCFYYAVFIIDVYTKKIVGYTVSNHMRATANVAALTMALKHHKAPEIHHSDRGSQYIYMPYTTMLKRLNCALSMGFIAQDNAYAERINRTIKEEYLDYWKPQDFIELKRLTTKAVKHYNTKRLHNHIFRKTPQAFESEVLTLEQYKRPVVTIYAEGQEKMEMSYSYASNIELQALSNLNCLIVNKTMSNLKIGQH